MKKKSSSTVSTSQDDVVAHTLHKTVRAPHHTTGWAGWGGIFIIVVVWVAFLIPLSRREEIPPIPRTAFLLGLFSVTVYSIWAFLALLYYSRTAGKHKQDCAGKQGRHLRTLTIWFYTYRGSTIAVLAIGFFLGGARWLHLFTNGLDAFTMVFGFYLLILVWSLTQRHLLLRWATQGLPRWLKVLLLGSTATGAGIGTGIGTILGRYGPRSLSELVIGLLCLGFALVFIPRAVYDLYVAYLHWQAWRREKEVAS